MGDVRSRKYSVMRSRSAFMAMIIAVLVAGCSSAPPAAMSDGVGASGAASAGIVAAIPALVIESVSLEQGDGKAEIELESSGPLVWTSFRDHLDNLIVELPNSVPSEGVEDLDLRGDGGFVESVLIEQEENGDRPLTRLVIRTSVESEHAVVAENGKLRVEVNPISGTEMGQGGMEQLIAGAGPDENENENENPTVPAAGTADNPQLGPPPIGVPATQLQGIEVSTEADATVVRIKGDGEFYYLHFPLENPDRFVIDLTGVVNTAPRSNYEVGTTPVDRIRVAQYKPRPELVSRVVIDLTEPSHPEVIGTGDGVVLRFSELGGSTLLADIESDLAATEIVPVPEQGPSADDPESEISAPPVAEEVEIAAATMASIDPIDETVAEDVVVEEAAAEVVEAETWSEPEVAELPEVEDLPDEEISEPVSWTAEPYQEYEVAEEVAVEPDPEPVAYDDLPTSEYAVSASESAEYPPLPVVEPAAEPMPLPPPAADTSFPSQDITVPAADVSPRPGAAAFSSQTLGEIERVYQGAPMDMTLTDADVRDVLRTFAQLSDLNVVVQPNVSGSVTVELHQVPWDQALDQILKINGLGYQIEGNIMRIAPITQLRQEAEDQQRLAEAQSQSVPLQTMIKRISYAAAGEIAGILQQGGGASIMSQRGSVVVDGRTNTLIIKELPEYVDTVMAVIETLDSPEPQVMIEARIIETTKQFSRSLGIAWQFLGIADAAHGNTTGLIFPNNGTAEGGASLLTGGANGFLNLSLGNILDTFQLDIALQAAESDGLVNIVSAPKVATLNNENASIQSGLQIPVQTTSNNTVSVQFVNATLRLNVTPHVTAEGTVLMDIDIQKREPLFAFAVAGAPSPPIATREARTRVIVRDGGTTVIGGIYEVTTSSGEDRVPGLAKIPIIKHLFKNKRREENNDELLIFITPRVMKF